MRYSYIINRFFSKAINMHKEVAKNLLEKSPEEVKIWLNSFDAVLTDCDGVLWLYNETLEKAPQVINKFLESGKKVYFVTNNSTRTRSEFLEKSIKLGFNVKLDNLISTAYTAAQYLKNRSFNGKVYVIGSRGITGELDGVGIQHTGTGPDPLPDSLQQFVHNKLKIDNDVKAVIVGFDEHFSFPKLTKACSYLNNPECLFIATNTDERFPMPEYVIPGTGALVKAVEIGAERKPIIIGKPNPYICETLLKEKIILPERTLMIGDRCNTDILLGKNCGFQTLLVGTGIHTLNDVKTWSESKNEDDKLLIPDYYLPKLGDLFDLM